MKKEREAEGEREMETDKERERETESEGKIMNVKVHENMNGNLYTLKHCLHPKWHPISFIMHY